MAAAKEAFPTWSKFSPEERAKILNRLADLIDANLEELAQAESRDQGGLGGVGGQGSAGGPAETYWVLYNNEFPSVFDVTPKEYRLSWTMIPSVPRLGRKDSDLRQDGGHPSLGLQLPLLCHVVPPSHHRMQPDGAAGLPQLHHPLPCGSRWVSTRRATPPACLLDYSLPRSNPPPQPV